jgi:hypothetical protein
MEGSLADGAMAGGLFYVWQRLPVDQSRTHGVIEELTAFCRQQRE